MASRATGWIQDSGSLENLIKVVELFDHESSTHKELVDNILPQKVSLRDGVEEMITNLQDRTGTGGFPNLNYRLLVGTSFTPRSSARCNGIIQALIPGQKRDFISDWPANNFLRMAETFGFVCYNQNNDTYVITDFGLTLTRAENMAEKFSCIMLALLKYPPVTRILRLLYKSYEKNQSNSILTKFELGKNLGFRGEDGFTTYPQHLVVHAIASTTVSSEQNKIRTDWEGSSDKYARMICGWLAHKEIKWIAKKSKEVKTDINGVTFKTSLNQAYSITLDGIKALRKSRQRSSNAAIEKLVPFEMLSTKGQDINYLRTRRALLIHFLSTWKTLEQMENHLKQRGLKEVTKAAIMEDLKNIMRIGLSVKEHNEKYMIADKVAGLTIPPFSIPQLTPSYVTKTKISLLGKIKVLDHAFFDLLDLGFDSTQNRLLELKVVDLLNQIPGVKAKHLSGGNRPEVVAFYPENNPIYGIIIDTKAYKDGFSIPISERDKMIRYINEYDQKNPALNTTKWWENFQAPDYPSEKLVYGYVSGRFTGQFQNQLNYIKTQTNWDGAVVTPEKLIEKVDQILDASNPYSISDLIREFTSNTEI